MLIRSILTTILLWFATVTCFQAFYGVQARKNLDVDNSNELQDCHTGNVIDDCWRCYNSTWYENRKRLASCTKGFGKKANGGKTGQFYTVTDDTDDPMNPKFGTLRYGVIQEHPLWIIFERSMTINLKTELIIHNDKTIDGRGASVHVTGYGCITLQYVSHVIIHGVHVHDCKPSPPGYVAVRPGVKIRRGGSDGDGIKLFGARNVWIDHCSFWSCSDGLIDVIMNSTHVTISNNHFKEHDKVMLLGYNDDDAIEEKILRVTLAYNHFGKNLVQRMPRCRHGRFHIVNNYYSKWENYAIGGTANPWILSQSNVFVAPDKPFNKEVTSRIHAQDWTNWNWLSHGDELKNGAKFTQSGKSDIEFYKPMISMKARSSAEVVKMTADAGVLKCEIGMACVRKTSE
ncbi:uncharacterized protein A4U43_C07F34250 [Asparagus officinalis]|uniref:Pectate lyase n=1 Tax=Asparagus officinalis TaxID=4686 RepID=A0A5P1EH91_ASPOF|nr:probable pectate lyase 1 [Asparagus officinalis]ONK65154.1 uncharacterized protein A4U43_C07F34250 [Asparagus officinalis]